MANLASAGDADRVLELFDIMKRSDLEPKLLCYNTLINALAIANRPMDAIQVFDEMRLSGVTPNVSTYNIMVKFYCLANQFDLACGIMYNMDEPDSVTYSTIISSFCKAGKIEEAMGVLDLMLENKCSPTFYTYTPIVQAYCSQGNLEEAKKLMRIMESYGCQCQPNAVTYNILINALCNTQNFNEVKEIIEESAKKGWTPDVVTYNTYMTGLCKSGRIAEVFEVYDMMQRVNLCPTFTTLSILLDCLCRDLKNIREAKSLLESWSHSDWGIHVACYNRVMSRLCRMGCLFDVLVFFSDMLKRGVTPNTRTYNIVIHTLCRKGNISEAVSVCRRGEFNANVVTFNTLFHWVYKKGPAKEVSFLLSDMKAKKIAPDAITYDILIDRSTGN